MEEVFGCPMGAFSLSIIKGMKNKSDPTCFFVLWNLKRVHFAYRFVA